MRDSDKLHLLKEENKRLIQLAERDWLTGAYNRMAMEQKVNNWLETEKCGTLFVLDVDNFKAINDRYGHIAGDQVLQRIAELLVKMAYRADIVGRIGGDEFVVFMPASRDAEFIESRCCQIEQRFQGLPRSQFIVQKISLTVCGSSYQTGDDYQSLFDRADQMLLREKMERKKQKAVGRGHVGDSLKIDMEKIGDALSEPGKAEGAYCLDYDSFVCIYRFMERRLRRRKSEIYSILFTLTDEQGEFPPLQVQNGLMEELQEIIRSSLRLGDVFTRYSSCQYLVMVCDATDQQTDTIAGRIQERYRQRSPVEDKIYCLNYNRHPLQPAFLREEEGAAQEES